MKKYLLFLLIPLLFVACQKEEDNNSLEPEYKILKYEESGSIFCSYTYPTIDENGKPVTLSSALAAWLPAESDSASAIRSVIIGCHITIASDAECPSMLTSSSAITDSRCMYAIPASATIPELRQSIVIMPDYQGYGISKHLIHPYMSQELTARQVADAVIYGLKLYKDLENSLPFTQDWKSFCLGFSQGGAVALATQRYIEQNSLDDELHFAGSFCGDGPYDLIETLRYYVLDDGNSDGVQTTHAKGITSMPVVLPLLVKGMLDSNPGMKEHVISDYFSKQMLDTGIMEWLDGKEKSTNDIAHDLYNMCENGLTAKDGTYYTPEQMQSLFPDHSKTTSLLMTTFDVNADLSKMLNEELFEYLSDPSVYRDGRRFTGNRFDDLMASLESNSIIKGWEPSHRIILLHSKYDTVVPYSNLVSFTDNHPDAEINVHSYGTKDHQQTGTNFFLALLNTTFSADLTWLFAEK